MANTKICIVTGAASGIGLDIAKNLAKDGCKVVMADIDGSNLVLSAERIHCDFFESDLSRAEACKNLVDYAIEKYGRVDILVNVAGIQTISPIEDFPEERWNLMLSLMLTAPFLLTKYVWTSMKENRWGRIINLNSIHGLVASEYKAAYVSAKHGLMGLTKTAALEGGKYGITVNSICPAYVKTPLVDNQIEAQALNHGISKEEVISKIMLEKAAVKTLLEPSVIVEAVKFLCSETGDNITGSALTIDGGWTAS